MQAINSQLMPAKQTIRMTSRQLVRIYLEVCYGSFVTMREIRRDTFSIYVVIEDTLFIQ